MEALHATCLYEYLLRALGGPGRSCHPLKPIRLVSRLDEDAKLDYRDGSSFDIKVSIFNSAL